MAPEFHNLEVLMDSHDLSLNKGTGIRNYGLNLISALQTLGANPELLVTARHNGDPVVSRALLYDSQPRRERNIRGRINAFKVKMRLKMESARHIPPNGGADGLPVPDSIFPFGLG